MSLFGEIEKLMNAGESSFNFRILNLGGNALYVEGIKGVVSFGETEMVFQLKKVNLYIFGEFLKVKYLDKSTCVVEGKIFKVETK